MCVLLAVRFQIFNIKFLGTKFVYVGKPSTKTNLVYDLRVLEEVLDIAQDDTSQVSRTY